MAANNVDDPWLWSVARVCHEITRNDRSWTPSPRRIQPNLDELRQNLQHHGVDGEILLADEHNWVLVNDYLGLGPVHEQEWLREGIREFRARSPIYRSKYSSSFYVFTQQYRQDLAAAFGAVWSAMGTERPYPSPLLPAPQSALPAPATVAPTAVATLPASQLPVSGAATASPTQITSVNRNGVDVTGTQQDATEAENEEQGYGPGAKRLKSGSADHTGDSAPQFADGAPKQDTQSVRRENASGTAIASSTLDPVPSVHPAGSNPGYEGLLSDSSPKADTPASSETGVDRSDVDTVGSEQVVLPSPDSSTFIFPETAAGSTGPVVEGIGQNPKPQAEVKKPPKRLAFGQLTQVGEIDPNRNRALPTYDEILGFDIILDSSIADRKRLAPQLLPVDSEEYTKSAWANLGKDDTSSDQSDVEAADELGEGDSDQGISESLEYQVVLANILPAVQPAISTRRRRARAAKYLPNKKLSVDDLFYDKVSFGADLMVDSIASEDKYFSHVKSRQLPPGQVRYVGKMMRNFMLSKQDVNRTQRPSGPRFSTDLLAVDITRDAEGKTIPPVVFESSIWADNVDEDFVGEDEEPFDTPNSEVTSTGSHVVSGEITRQDNPPAVAWKTPVSEGGANEQPKDNKTYAYFTAVRTYPEGDGKVGYVSLLDTPSFTLYYTTTTGEVHARREKFIDWPELMGGKDRKDFVAYDPLSLIGSRPELDPDSLLRWQKCRSVELPVFLESGDEGAYDAATWREIDREARERARRRTRQRGTPITPFQIHNIWTEAINDFIVKWQKQKLPKLETTARGIWTSARRTRTKRIRIQAARNDLQSLQTRLTNLQTQFASVPWTSWHQAVKGCRNAELTVFDIQKQQWIIDTLGQKTSPGMPFANPTKRASGPKAETPPASQETEDKVSDDGLGDFIVSDREFDAEGSGEEELVDDMEDSDDESEGGDRPKKKKKSRSPDESNDHLNTPVREQKAAKGASAIIDLTDSPPAFGPSGSIDLITPEKKPTATLKPPKFTLKNRRNSPVVISSESEIDLPPYNNPMAIAERPYEYWQKLQDRKRLLIRVFYKLEDSQRMLRLFARYDEGKLWELMCQVLQALRVGYNAVDCMGSRLFEGLAEIAQLLDMYMECKYVPWGRDMTETWCRAVLGARSWWHGFYKLCSRMDGYLNSHSSPEPSSSSPLGKGRNLNKHQLSNSDSDDDGPTKRRRARAPTGESDDVPVIFSPQSIRKRPVVEDASARDARKRNAERITEQERRRTILKAKLAESGNSLEHGNTKHIINDAAALDQGHVHVNEEIGRQIKEHQVDGVRFMWNQIVAVGDEHSMQGCLLAHTMGLGKTMQVITLLVSIAEAASSPDPSISSQVPSCLKGTLKTLVLCPPGLIDNWMDELLFWTPGNTLGDFWKLTSNSHSVKDRLHYLSQWYKTGGVLIIGYEMLRNLIKNKPTATRQAQLTTEEHKQVVEELLQGPDIIIADEAHKLKNAKSSLAVSASGFRSKCRIALTGSPLANNVEEYHSMIEFVQPGYLGGAVEFRSKYKEPIEAGLFADSDSAQRRMALVMLGVLNKELALKVNRADLSVLRNDLPPKKEFVMSVPLTDIQRQVYSLYVESLKCNDAELTKDGEVKQTTIWSWLATLSLLCNHPYCFNTKLQEGKEDPLKQATPDNTSDDNLTAQLIDVPFSKVGLSKAFIRDVRKLFTCLDLTQASLSNKVFVTCQILDAAKAAGDKALIFSSSIPTLDFLETLFKAQGRSMARLDGKTRIGKRQRLIKDFNSGSDELFLISTTAGGLGLNLQSANRVVIFDFKYNPIQEEQAVGRAYRIGQKKPTFVYRFVCGGTFEDNVHNKTIFKAQLASRVVDKKSVLVRATKNFGEFLFPPKEVPQKDLSEFRGMDPAVLDKILASQNQKATIRSIIQTDSFEMDDEDRLTPEEQQVVDRTIQANREREAAHRQAQHLPRTQSRQAMTPQGHVQSSAQHAMQSGPSATPQARPQQSAHFVNRPQTGTPQGCSTPYSNPAGTTSVSSSGIDRNNPPVMGANTRVTSRTPSPYRKVEEARRQSGMVTNVGTAGETPSQRAQLPASSGGSHQSKPKKAVNDLFPVIADGYKSKNPAGVVASGSSTFSTSSPLPESARQRIRAVAEEITAAVAKHSTLGPDRLRQMDSVSKLFNANRAIVRQIIDRKLTADGFVQGLVGRGLGSDQETSAMHRAMEGQFSSSSSRTPKTPRTTNNARDTDLEAIALVNQRRYAKGEPPVTKHI